MARWPVPRGGVWRPQVLGAPGPAGKVAARWRVWGRPRGRPHVAASVIARGTLSWPRTTHSCSCTHFLGSPLAHGVCVDTWGQCPAGELLTGAAVDTALREMPTSEPVSSVPVPSLSSGSQDLRPSARPGAGRHSFQERWGRCSKDSDLTLHARRKGASATGEMQG